MRALLQFIYIVSITLAASGCGTILNNWWFTPSEGGEQVYGGTRLDWRLVNEKRGLKERLILLADMPFSFVGDTLTLPYTISLENARSREMERQETTLKEAAKPE